MAVSYATYERVALEDDSAIWELVCGRLREKQGMTQDHNRRASALLRQLFAQLEEADFDLRMNAAALKISSGTYYVPDVVVLPRNLPPAGPSATSLEMYDKPLPFVAEVWSPSTGTKDSETKVPDYQLRGDQEIWRIHPIDRDIVAWRRQPDGSYVESRYSGGFVPIESLPGVTIDLSRLFA